jgi:hypothetical protein
MLIGKAMLNRARHKKKRTTCRALLQAQIVTMDVLTIDDRILQNKGEGT